MAGQGPAAVDPGFWQNALVWMEETGVASAVRESRWTYPVIEIVHILGFVILVGAAAMFDLRLLGASRGLPVADVARHLLRWSLASLVLVVPSGVLLFITDAVATWDNPAFRVKMALLAAAGINAMVFHFYVFKRVDEWDVDSVTPARAKMSAVASLILWAGVIASGRLIAYV